MKKLIFFTCICLLPLFSLAQQLGEKHTLNSTVLGEQREIIVSLPENYDSEKNYQFPVLYLTDASTQFNHIASMVHYLSGTISPMIVVGVFNPNRGAELSPFQSDKAARVSSEKFRQFIANEVKPYIEDSHRANGFSILSGHSFGGAFTFNAYQKNNNDFNVYISLAPTMAFGNEVMLEKMPTKLKQNSSTKLYVYLEGQSSFPTPENTFIQLKEQLSSFPQIESNIELQLLPNEDHMTVSHMGTYLALKHLYNGFFLSVLPVMEDTSAFDKHYESLSHRLGYKVKPTEYELWGLVTALIRRKNMKEAEYIANKSLSYYPNSHFSYSLMADVAESNNDKALQIKHLKRAVELSKDLPDRQTRYQKRLSEI